MKLYLIIIILCLTVNSYTQNKELDSLYNIIKTSENISNIAYAHSRVAWLTAYSDLNAAKKHLDTSFTIYSNLKDENGIANTHYKYAALNRVSGDYKKYS